MSKNLPQLSHLQIAVLDCLSTEECSGKDLRDALTNYGVRKNPPAFYQLMSRMETAGFVKGWYEQCTVGDQIVRERRYKVTGSGRAALAQAKIFYANLNDGGEPEGIPSYA